MQLGPRQLAQLAEDPSQPGWDLRIPDAASGVAEELLLNVTSSMGCVEHVLEPDPEMDVLATAEGASRMGD